MGIGSGRIMVTRIQNGAFKEIVKLNNYDFEMWSFNWNSQFYPKRKRSISFQISMSFPKKKRQRGFKLFSLITKKHNHFLPTLVKLLLFPTFNYWELRNKKLKNSYWFGKVLNLLKLLFFFFRIWKT